MVTRAGIWFKKISHCSISIQVKVGFSWVRTVSTTLWIQINYSNSLCWVICSHPACPQGIPQSGPQAFPPVCDLLRSKALAGGTPSAQGFTMHLALPCSSCVRSVRSSRQPFGGPVACTEAPSPYLQERREVPCSTLGVGPEQVCMLLMSL